jgi:hypothetical protein
VEKFEESTSRGMAEVNDQNAIVYFAEVFETVGLLAEIERYIETGSSDVYFDPVPEIIRKEMRFRLDILTLFALNEDDKKIVTVVEYGCIYIQFAGRKSYYLRNRTMEELDNSEMKLQSGRSFFT